METYTFKLFYSKEDKGWIITCDQYRGFSAFGKTSVEAMKQGAAAFDILLESLAEMEKRKGEFLDTAENISPTIGKALRRANAGVPIPRVDAVSRITVPVPKR